MSQLSKESFDACSFSQPSDVLNIVLDHITQGMVVVGPDFCTLAFNRHFEEMFQLPSGTVTVGQDFREILRVWARETGQDQEMLDFAISQLTESEPFEFEFEQLIHGIPRWCLMTHNPLPNHGFVRTFSDITSRKNGEQALKESEARCRAMIGAFDGMVYICSSDYRIEFMNDRLKERTGRDATGELCYKALHELDAMCPWCVNGRVFNGENVRWEVKSPKDNRWYEVSNSPIFNADGSISKQSMISDITDRKNTEESLHESVMREKERANELHAVMESVPAIILIAHDLTGSSITGNQLASEVLHVPMKGNFSKRAVKGDGPQHYTILHNNVETTPKDLPLHRALQGEYINNYQQDVLFDDGTIVSLFGNAIPLKDDQGQVRGAVAAFMDVTTHQQTSKNLQESEERYRVVFEQSPDGIVLVDPGTLEIHYFNDAACRNLGYTREEFSHLTIKELDAVEEQQYVQERGRRLMADGATSFEAVHCTKQGGLRNVEVNLKLLTISGRTMCSAIFHDITERKQAEAALKASEEKFKTFVEMSIDVIFVLDSAGVFQFVSPAWEHHFGYPADDVTGRSFAPFVHPEDTPLCIEYLTTVLTTGVGGTSPPYRVKHADGSWRTFLANGTSYVDGTGTVLYIGVGRDMSDQKRAEEERIELERRLLQGQKLESLGVLAGGIAHDFNNLLAVIIGNLDLALLRLSPESPIVRNIEQSMKASHRAAGLIRQMLEYSGKGVFQLQIIDLNKIIGANTDLFNAVVPRNVTLSVTAGNALPPVLVDPGQIQQVVMNLITNAVEAVGANQGVVSLSSGVAECDEQCIRKSRLDEKPAPGAFVYIEVTDNGCGMDEETQRRLFEPFFTTKFTGRGLGMAATQGIVRTHRGIILLESSIGKGTTIRILFPITDGSIAQRLAPLHAASVKTGLLPGRKGKILVVDDEDSVRALGAEYAGYMGFETIEASDGAEALELFQRHIHEIVLVILDLSMPNMDGITAFHELKKIKPDVRVLLSSGYSEKAISEQFTQEKPDFFIQKPFLLKDLEAKIAMALS